MFSQSITHTQSGNIKKSCSNLSKKMSAVEEQVNEVAEATANMVLQSSVPPPVTFDNQAPGLVVLPTPTTEAGVELNHFNHRSLFENGGAIISYVTTSIQGMPNFIGAVRLPIYNSHALQAYLARHEPTLRDIGIGYLQAHLVRTASALGVNESLTPEDYGFAMSVNSITDQAVRDFNPWGRREGPLWLLNYPSYLEYSKSNVQVDLDKRCETWHLCLTACITLNEPHKRRRAARQWYLDQQQSKLNKKAAQEEKQHRYNARSPQQQPQPQQQQPQQQQQSQPDRPGNAQQHQPSQHQQQRQGNSPSPNHQGQGHQGHQPQAYQHTPKEQLYPNPGLNVQPGQNAFRNGSPAKPNKKDRKPRQKFEDRSSGSAPAGQQWTQPQQQQQQQVQIQASPSNWNISGIPEVPM